MPMSGAFEERLFPKLPGIIKHFGTPFHIYDEQGIIDTAHNWKREFKDVHGFKEFFAVKALPNPAILDIMKKLGFGLDLAGAGKAPGDRLAFGGRKRVMVPRVGVEPTRTLRSRGF